MEHLFWGSHFDKVYFDLGPLKFVPVLVIFTMGYHFGEKGEMQYYHFRSTRRACLYRSWGLRTIQTKGDRRPSFEVFPVLRSSSEHVRRAGDKRVGVSRSTPAAFSIQTRERIAPVLQASKSLIIYSTPVVHLPAWLSDQSEFWCLVHSPTRNGERRRKL